MPKPSTNGQKVDNFTHVKNTNILLILSSRFTNNKRSSLCCLNVTKHHDERLTEERKHRKQADKPKQMYRAAQLIRAVDRRS